MNTTATQTPTFYRAFNAYADLTNGVFVIKELPSRTDHPAQWLYTDGITAQSAWLRARATALPVVVTLLNGSTMDLGVTFGAEAFERAAYGGYVSYGYSMSDGYYAPIKFDAWVISFRRGQGREILNGNDTPQYVKDALPLYQKSL